MLHIEELAGWKLLWLVPYRLLYFFLYAMAWFKLLRPYDPDGRAGFGYVLWVTTVREAIDRLLPVASIGGGVVGVRLMRWRNLAGIDVSASILVEILLTLMALYLFSAMGLILLIGFSAAGAQYRHLLPALLFGLLIPLLTTLLLRYGSVFERLEGFLRPLVGISAMSEGAASLDREVRACLRRGWTLLFAGGLQLIALILGSLEIWFVLHLFGHPIGITAALILESMVQAMRHLAFAVPAGLGVQEAGLVIFGHAFGVSSELALAVSLAKRIREVLCGLPPLLTWQWLEGRRLQRPAGNVS
jgi:putative membrane protein